MEDAKTQAKRWVFRDGRNFGKPAFHENRGKSEPKWVRKLAKVENLDLEKIKKMTKHKQNEGFSGWSEFLENKAFHENRGKSEPKMGQEIG